VSSVTKHALEVAGFVVACFAILEFQLALRRSSTPQEAKPEAGGPWSYRRQWERIRYDGTYGSWVTVVRGVVAVVVIVALIVALISALVG
jgi:hypothetical protein